MRSLVEQSVPRHVARLSILALVGAAALAVAGVAGEVDVDPLAAVLTTLTLLIATVVLGFSERYMRADSRRMHFTLEVAAFSAAMIVLAFATDLISFAAAWVASGQLLVRLVGHVTRSKEALLAASRCRRSFLIGDAALILGLLLLGTATGTLRIASTMAALPEVPPLITGMAAGLLVVAAAVRCALPPFSGWLLGSMSAPTPVSALMHGGFVNGGGFLLLRFSGVLGAAPAVQGIVVAMGLLAAIYGGAVMLVRPDVKGALAGSTVSQMGFMLLTCGLGAYAAALWHLVAHGLFKAWLFLGSGSTVGMADPSRPMARRPLHAVVISAATLAVAAALLGRGAASTAVIPQLLALATGLSALSLVRNWRALPLIVGGGALLLVGLVGGFVMQLLVADRAFSFGGPAVLGILALLLAGWIAQRLIASRGLPPSAYVRLVNSGALHAR